MRIIKKLLLILVLTIAPVLVHIPLPVHAEPYWYNCTALTGGGDTALDAISGIRLNDADVAIVLTSAGHTYFYVMDADNGLTESSPFRIQPDNVPGDKMWVLQTISWNSNIQTLADDATPSVSGGKVFLTGGTTTITDLDDGITGQVIHIISEHAITITGDTNIFMNGGGNFIMAATDTLTLVCKADNKWYELGRSDNTP